MAQPEISMSRGAEASQLLADPAFLARWAGLCDRCPWATTYQRPEFAATWYRVYAATIEPILITSRGTDQQLTGLLCLAVSLQDQRLFAAGDVQAEYQIWISEPDQGDAFAMAALAAVGEAFPSRSLSLRYLPPAAPLAWLSTKETSLRCVLVKKSRPLLRFAQRSDDSLSKVNNRKRLKSLKKLGEPVLSRITCVEQLKQCLDELAIFYDFRLGAMYGYEPFSHDPLRKTLQLELMKQPNLLHATELKVGDRLASVHVNIRDRIQIHMNLMGYSPLLAKHSPGKFHIHMLSRMLEDDGYEELDLTPGGDPYKERFANAHDTAYVLSVHPGRWLQAKDRIHAHVDTLLRRMAKIWQLHPARVRHTREWLAHHGLRGLTAAVGRRVFSSRATWLFNKDITCSGAKDHFDHRLFRRDAIDDLLRYKATPGGLTRRQFLFESLDRLEHGQHAYTCVRDGRLAYVGWLMEHPSEAFVSRLLPGVKLARNRRLILGMQAIGSEHDEELASSCLRAMLTDLASGRQAVPVTAVLPADDSTVRHFEEAGFHRQGALMARTICGRLRHAWRETPGYREEVISPVAVSEFREPRECQPR